MIASSQGGVNIEEVAAENPQAILYEPINITNGKTSACIDLVIHFRNDKTALLYIESGLTKDQALKVAAAVGLEDKKEQTAEMLLRLYDLFLKKDALLIEVNPYAEDASGKCKCEISQFLCSFQHVAL